MIVRFDCQHGPEDKDERGYCDACRAERARRPVVVRGYGPRRKPAHLMAWQRANQRRTVDWFDQSGEPRG